VAYAGVAREKFNAVSGVMNVSRNLGGSIGIAFVTTLIARRSQFHQSNLAGHTTALNPWFTSQIDGMARALERAGTSAADAGHQALAFAYQQMQAQALQLAYLDALHVLAIAVACMLPLLFLAKAPKPGGPVPTH